MNYKSLLFSLMLLINATLAAMQPKAGAVIDPINQTGQYTVSLPNKSLASVASPLPTVTQISKASHDFFKNKGVPVIITSAASIVPWWALTTGTGYLLISQCNISDPALLASLAAGASYAAGEQTSSLIKRCISNQNFQSATQLALCAACIGASYTGSSPIMNSALFVIAQAIGLQTVLENSSRLFTHKQEISPTSTLNGWVSSQTKEALMDGTVNALSTLLPSLCTTNLCDSNAMLRILLYEQAYRLAQCGCAAAQQFARN